MNIFHVKGERKAFLLMNGTKYKNSQLSIVGKNAVDCNESARSRSKKAVKMKQENGKVRHESGAHSDFISENGYLIAMNKDFTFTISSLCFDESYHPSDSTRITTNFANLARGESRQENLRNALKMVDNRFNALAH